MKKQKRFFNYIIPIALMGFLLIGCAKETTTRVDTTSNATTQTAIAADEVTLNNEFDLFVDDAIAVLSNHNATLTGAYPPDSVSPGLIEITYNDKTVFNSTKTRLGADSMHFNPAIPWSTPGATATLSFGDQLNAGYEVNFESNNPVTSVRLNGILTIINQSGGLLQNLASGDSIVVILKGSLTYTFNDNAATIVYYPFNVCQIRSIKNVGGVFIASTFGDTAIGGYQKVCNWGLDRFANTYYTSINTVVVQNISNASLAYNPISGVKNIQGISEPIICAFGVNSAGNVITSGIPFGQYISWYNNGGGANAVVPYYY